MNWVIKGRHLYWSNNLGWTTLDQATIFTGEEMQRLDLPVGGHWEREREEFVKAVRTLNWICNNLLTDSQLDVKCPITKERIRFL